MANARDAALGSLARRAHIRNEAGVRSRLIVNAMPRLHLRSVAESESQRPRVEEAESGVRDGARRY